MRMKMKTLLAAGMVLMMTAIANLALGFDTSKLQDLTYSFNSDTIYWPTEKPLQHEFEKFGMTDLGYFYSSAKYAAPEHGGTHMDAPIHFNQNGIYADQVPLANCVGPAAVIDFSARAATDPDAM